MITPLVLLIVDGYLFLKESLYTILTQIKISLDGSDEEEREAQVIVAKLYLFFEIALPVTHNLKTATADLLQYLSLFVMPNLLRRSYVVRVSCIRNYPTVSKHGETNFHARHSNCCS